MASGSIETLRSGFRARVYAEDPITHKQTYLRGGVRRSRADAEADKERLLALADTGEKVELKRTVGTLLDRWMETVDHELSTAETSGRLHPSHDQARARRHADPQAAAPGGHPRQALRASPPM
ncbi:hypothetical protein GCM10023175_67300 [Pseudonocardia xishanensis]|uniref:Integrase-like protein n=1 Tax=Pseudonocardia xishanensis TaxID=630995 RepID=A0ABP8S2H7_9PSEU